MFVGVFFFIFSCFFLVFSLSNVSLKSVFKYILVRCVFFIIHQFFPFFHYIFPAFLFFHYHCQMLALKVCLSTIFVCVFVFIFVPVFFYFSVYFPSFFFIFFTTTIKGQREKCFGYICLWVFFILSLFFPIFLPLSNVSVKSV